MSDEEILVKLTDHWDKVYKAMRSSSFGWGESPSIDKANKSVVDLGRAMALAKGLEVSDE